MFTQFTTGVTGQPITTAVVDVGVGVAVGARVGVDVGIEVGVNVGVTVNTGGFVAVAVAVAVGARHITENTAVLLFVWGAGFMTERFAVVETCELQGAAGFRMQLTRTLIVCQS